MTGAVSRLYLSWIFGFLLNLIIILNFHVKSKWILSVVRKGFWHFVAVVCCYGAGPPLLKEHSYAAFDQFPLPPDLFPD